MSRYCSVTEYAKLTGKDPGNIRRMLLAGRLMGEKVGNQWIIPADAAYPKDQRVHTGAYMDWRKKNDFYGRHRRLRPVFDRFVRVMQEIYQTDLSSIIVYGSYARNEQTEDSDIDVAVVLKKKSSDKQHDRMIDEVIDLELQFDIVLSVVVIEADEMSAWGDKIPFYNNLRSEGIRIWNIQ